MTTIDKIKTSKTRILNNPEQKSRVEEEQKLCFLSLTDAFWIENGDFFDGSAIRAPAQDHTGYSYSNELTSTMHEDATPRCAINKPVLSSSVKKHTSLDEKRNKVLCFKNFELDLSWTKSIARRHFMMTGITRLLSYGYLRRDHKQVFGGRCLCATDYHRTF